MAGPFTDLLLASTSPWNDHQGTWEAYNTAIAAMFEATYDIVSDRGDINQTQLATLTAQVSIGDVVTQASTTKLLESLASGTKVIFVTPDGTRFQDFTVATNAVANSTVVLLEPKKTPFTFPVGSFLQLAFIPGWSHILDPDDCPTQLLPFLAQFVGAIVPVGTDDATARTKITEESGQQRGTVAAVKSAVQRNLTGTQSVGIIERTDAVSVPNAYRFVVVVKASEVISVQALTSAVDAVRPGGVMWTLIQSDGFTWSGAIHTWAADTFSWSSAANIQP